MLAAEILRHYSEDWVTVVSQGAVHSAIIIRTIVFTYFVLFIPGVCTIVTF